MTKEEESRARLDEDLVKFVRWCANVRSFDDDPTEIARSLLLRIETAPPIVADILSDQERLERLVVAALNETDAIWQFGHPRKLAPEERLRRMAASLAPGILAAAARGDRSQGSLLAPPELVQAVHDLPVGQVRGEFIEGDMFVDFDETAELIDRADVLSILDPSGIDPSTSGPMEIVEKLPPIVRRETECE